MYTQNEDNLNDRFLMAAQEGNLELVRVLLGQPLISLDTFDTAIQKASQNGDLKVVECLLGDSRVNPSIAVFSAVKNRQLKVLQCLLKHPDANPGGLKNIAIRKASEEGDLTMVECLLKDSRVNPGDLENDAIRKASKNGHLKIVECLLKDPRVNPSDFKNDALALAGIEGHIKVMKLLLTCPKVYQNSNNLVFQDICLGGNLEAVQLLIRHTKVQEKCIEDVIIDGKIKPGIRNYLKFVQQTRNEIKLSWPNRSIKEIQQNFSPEQKKYWPGIFQYIKSNTSLESQKNYPERLAQLKAEICYCTNRAINPVLLLLICMKKINTILPPEILEIMAHMLARIELEEFDAPLSLPPSLCQL